MSLLSKIYFKPGKNDKLIDLMTNMEVKSIQSLASSVDTSAKCQLMPGCHDFLASIGQNWCLIRENVDSALLEINEGKINQLFSSNIEYSMNFMRGCLIYLKNFQEINSVNQRLYSKIIQIFRFKIFEAIKQCDKIRNNLNLKIVIFVFFLIVGINRHSTHF
jgi:hypothetical protein